MTGSLIIDGKVVSFDELRSTPLSADHPHASALSFCHQWLHAAPTFELQTSGSTGVPKRWVAQRAQMEASARATQHALGLMPGQSALLCLDPSFIAGKMMLVRAMVIGLNLHVVPPTANPLDYPIPEEGIDFCAVVPYQLTHMITSPDRLARIRKIIVGGAAVDPALETQLQKLPTQFYATYGMTETVSHVALRTLNGVERSPMFRALEGISFRTDERGCLVIEAPLLSNTPFVTNDVVQLHDPLHFKWLGRFDFVINTGGVKVFPEKIEADIRSKGLIDTARDFLIVGFPDDLLGEKVTLLLTGERLSEIEGNQLLQRLKHELEKFEAPREIRYLRHVHLTPNGKIDRKRNLQTAEL